MKRTSLPLQRREFITLLGGAAAAWPLAARAQQSGDAADRVSGDRRDAEAQRIRLRSRRACANWATSKATTSRSSTAGPRRSRTTAELAAELVRRRRRCDRRQARDVAAVAASSDHNDPDRVRAFRDPVGAGLVASLARPGGNVTGLSHSESAIGGKAAGAAQGGRCRACRDRRCFVNPDALLEQPVAAIEGVGCAAIGVELHVGECRDADEIERAFATLAAQRAEALIVMAAIAFFIQRRVRSSSLRLGTRLPAIYRISRVRRGRRPDELRRQTSPTCIGARPSTSTAFSRARSRPTCRSSSRPSSSWSSTSRPPRRSASTVPPTLLARADEVIE